MNATPIRTLELENGQTLVMEDLSRRIGADAFVVKFRASMTINIEKSLFASDQLNMIQFNDIIQQLGHQVEYEYLAERNMIMDHEKDQVLEGLTQTFLDNIKAYIEKPSFPGKLVLKKYKDAAS